MVTVARATAQAHTLVVAAAQPEWTPGRYDSESVTLVATARPHMNVCVFSESLVAAAQSPNHPSHDDQWYFNSPPRGLPVHTPVTGMQCQYQ